MSQPADSDEIIYSYDAEAVSLTIFDDSIPDTTIGVDVAKVLQVTFFIAFESETDGSLGSITSEFMLGHCDRINFMQPGTSVISDFTVMRETGPMLRLPEFSQLFTFGAGNGC